METWWGNTVLNSGKQVVLLREVRPMIWDLDEVHLSVNREPQVT